MPNGNGYHRVFHLPHWRYPSKLPGLTGLYLNTVFRTLALGLVGIFVPVFIYQFFGGWDKVISFYIVLHLTSVIFSIPTGYLIKKWGPDFLMGTGALTLFLGLMLLIKAQNNPNLLVWAAWLWGITVSFHWLPYHQAFSWESTRKDLSKQVAQRLAFNKIATAITPVAGGIIATKLGFSGLYFVAAVVLTISIIPIFMDQYNRRGNSLSFEAIRKNLLTKSNLPYWLGFFGTGVEAGVYGIFLPIFLFQNLKNLEQLGLVSTISLIMALVGINLVGKIAQKKEKTVFYLGLIASFPFWLVIGFFKSFILLAVAKSWYQITANGFWIPHLDILYREGRKQGKSFFVLRNIFTRLGTVFTLIIGALIISKSLGWTPIFMLGILSLLLITFFDQGLKNKK